MSSILNDNVSTEQFRARDTNYFNLWVTVGYKKESLGDQNPSLVNQPVHRSTMAWLFLNDNPSENSTVINHIMLSGKLFLFDHLNMIVADQLVITDKMVLVHHRYLD